MVLERRQVEDLKKLARAVARFSDALTRLAGASPPAERAQTDHPEIARLAREFDRATAIVETAARKNFMTGAEYARVAARFEAIAEAMEGGAARESAAEKRRRTGGRRATSSTARKPGRRRK